MGYTRAEQKIWIWLKLLAKAKETQVLQTRLADLEARFAEQERREQAVRSQREQAVRASFALSIQCLMLVVKPIPAMVHSR